MFQDGVFHFLPGHGLDQSILIAILVGMGLLLLFTEAYGWVYVGLVVPGYLASVFVIQPAAGTAVVFESVLTFLVARFVSDIASKIGSWSPFFGRERFFLIVLVSVLVRQASQVWMLPSILSMIDDSFGTALRANHGFSSIGLVLVPLCANMFWKLGLGNGIVQVAFPVVATYLVLQLLLLPLTNLSLSELELTYENVALDFLGSPKAYMILLSTAILAARYNLTFGWDYNGILVPSLIALTWFSPDRVLFTVVESLVLMFATRAFLAIPLFRMVNFEGPRKVFLVFTLGFVIKCLLGWTMVLWFPQIKITDYFGFGYVLTSLLAVKMLQKKVVGLVLLPTLMVSLMGFVIGSGIGFALEQVVPKRVGSSVPPDPDPAPTRALHHEPLGAMVLAHVRARPVLAPGLREGRTGTELGQYARLWRAIDRWLSAKPATDRGSSPTAAPAGTAVKRPMAIELLPLFEDVRDRAGALGLALIELETPSPTGPRFLLAEREERLRYQNGWEIALLSPGEPGPIVEVPRPRFEAPAAEFSAMVCQELRCRAVVASGVDPRDTRMTAGDPLGNPRSTFQVAHEQLRGAPILQVRTDTASASETAVLHLRHVLPPEFVLHHIWPRPVELSWEHPPGVLQQWDRRTDFGVLRAHPDLMWQVLQERYGRPIESAPNLSLSAWLGLRAEETGKQAHYVARPSHSEVLFLESLIAGDLLARQVDRLPWLNRLAGMLGYGIFDLPNCAGESACWVLGDETSRRRWGTLVVRRDPAEPFTVEVPRPVEEPGTVQMAIELWHAGNGDAMVFATPQPRSIESEDEEQITAVSKATPFQGLHQAAHRALAGRESALVVQVRGMSAWRPIPNDLVVAIGVPVLQARQIPASLDRLMAGNGPIGFMADTAAFANGAAQFVPLLGNSTPQMIFSRAAGDVDFGLLWFSQSTRDRFRRGMLSRHQQQIEQFSHGPVRISTALLSRDLLNPPLDPPGGEPPKTLLRDLDLLADHARRYAVTHNGYDLVRLGQAAARVRGAKVDVFWNETLALPIAFIEIETRADLVARVAVLLGAEVAEERADRCRRVDVTGPEMRIEVEQLLMRRCLTTTVFGRKTAAGRASP